MAGSIRRSSGWTRRFCTGSKYINVQVDRSGLGSLKSSVGRDAGVVEKTKRTPLTHFFETLIQGRGPLSVHEYMKQCLGHPEWGYYMNKDVFGTKGDFTTAPEISQMFGELIGIWCVATWQQMNCPPKLQIVEFGPGRGTLQSDLLSAARMFPEFYKAIEIHLVEMSPELGKLQQQSLPNDGPIVTWHKDLSTVPRGPSIFIAQEFFDALPVHQFQYTEKGWCERLVDVDLENGPHHFRYVLSNGATAAVRAYLTNQSLGPDIFELTDLQNPGSIVKMEEIKEGDQIEFSPMSVAVVMDIAQRVAQDTGGALIIDYGHNSVSSDSLRGIRDHEFVSSLEEPGQTDLSVDVDFAALSRFASQNKAIATYGAKTQGDFLREMGIEYRLKALLDACADDEPAAEKLIQSYQRLVEPDQMGKIFKAMSIVPKAQGTPVGFN